MAMSSRVGVGVALVAGVLTASLLITPQAMVATFESFAADPLTFGLVVAGLYLIRPLFAWPTTPLAIVVGYGYGMPLGVLIAMAGVMITILPPFFVTRWLIDGHEQSTPSRGRLATTLAKTERVVTKYYETTGPLRGVIVTRLAPIPSDISTCAAAVSGVRLRYLVAGTAIGELPWTVAGVMVGASAATLTTDGIGELGITLAVACGVAALMLLLGPLYRLLSRDSPTPS